MGSEMCIRDSPSMATRCARGQKLQRCWDLGLRNRPPKSKFTTTLLHRTIPRSVPRPFFAGFTNVSNTHRSVNIGDNGSHLTLRIAMRFNNVIRPHFNARQKVRSVATHVAWSVGLCMCLLVTCRPYHLYAEDNINSFRPPNFDTGIAQTLILSPFPPQD